MKKYLLLIFVVLSPFLLSAQTTIESAAMPDIPVDEEGHIRYIEVVKEPGIQKDLFKRCVKWINGAYKNPASVTPTRDVEDGKIVVRHNFRLYDTQEDGSVSQGSAVLYDMIIRFKDNRYRIEMTNFVLKKTSRFPAEKWMKKSTADYNPEYLKQLDAFAHEKIESLKKGMKPAKVYKEEDW